MDTWYGSDGSSGRGMYPTLRLSPGHPAGREMCRTNTLTTLSLHPLISHQDLPLAKSTRKPEGEGTYWCSPHRSDSQGTEQGREEQKVNVEGKMDLTISYIELQWMLSFMEAQRADAQYHQAKEFWLVYRASLELKWLKSLIRKLGGGVGEVLLSCLLEMGFLKVLIFSEQIIFQIVNHNPQEGKYGRVC